MVAETAVGQDRDLHPRWQNLGEPSQTGILVGIAVAGQFVLPHREPEQRRGPAVVGHQGQDQRCLPVPVELGPIHRHHDLAPATTISRR